MGFERAQILIFQALILCYAAAAAYPTPLNCSDTTRLCTSFLAFKPTSIQTLTVIQSMFDVLQEDITVEGNGRDYVFIKKNCSCAVGLKSYLTSTTFTVTGNNKSVYDLVINSYDGLAYFPPSNVTRAAKKGAVVALKLMCGCSSGLWNYLMSYVMRDGDSVESLASRFGVSMDSIVSVNGLSGPDNVTVGNLYYVPLNYVPGEPYPVKNDTIPAPAPAPSAADNFVVIGTDVFDVEKPVIFTYEEILSSTDGFSDSNLLGHGTYGSVYYGLLQDQVELIGYAASGDELFLIYEFAQKGPLRNHLHDPQNKGHTSLSWIMRLQIAIDAARGLEYIHEHTKPHYVHRDIKTSNILLDGSFRAKISDFGLAKLVFTTNDGEEYLRDGLATIKSDVYAYGVVLFEMISGKEAMSRSAERRSLVSIMVAAMRNSPDSMAMSSLKDHIDPSLMDLYPHDCLFKLAILAKQCVDEDPILRPDMKQVVISLSQILLSSVEWEATLAGNSQVFSGLVQGR
ncbi:lysm domain receptor-like kinase 3 [Phtheirospermum japonicum]|uniref:Lysm domain receptor-like kinase 3 n=1 Tax=Phtheirospermum japonicum TaxID=374723 RepID=A0A830BCP7_9LAMI|nr:lysm domain receptor-like kinase 3 [Phtheirospermum japonicum]